MIVLFLSMFENVPVGLVNPIVQTVERLNGQGRIDIHPKMTQPAKTGGNVEGDVVIPPASREPGPGSVRQLHLLELLESPAFLVIETVVIKENAHITAGFTLAFGLAYPWSLHQCDRLQILVLFQGTVQCLGSLPLIEYATNLGIRIGDLTGQRVCIEPVKGLLGTLMGKFHQVRQCHYRIPGRIGNHLDGKVLMFDGVGIARRHQFLKVKLLGLGSPDGQRHRFGHKDPSGKNGQVSLFPIGNLAGPSYCFVGDHSQIIRNGYLPRIGTGLLGRYFEIQIGHFIAEFPVHTLVGSGISKGQANRSLLDGR